MSGAPLPAVPGNYKPGRSVVKAIRQSPPIDLTKPYDIGWVKDKHILITGGASGFGASWARVWAKAGASLVLADVNTKLGTETVASIREETGNENVHFVKCDVTDWQSQVSMFKEAVRLSPHGGIDSVIANAGLAGTETFHLPSNDFSVDEPKAPDLRVINVNIIGVLYTTQLALWWLARNPGSKPASPDTKPGSSPRDRHLLLVSSIAGLAPIVAAPFYGTSKHAVLGLFRCLRASAHLEGVRVNVIFPFFIETPMNPTGARLLLAGEGMGTVGDVIDSASRLMADSSICGRGLCIAPRVKVKQQEDGDWLALPYDSKEGEEKGVWEVYAHDFEDTELFTSRMVALLNQITRFKSWADIYTDVKKALTFWYYG